MKKIAKYQPTQKSMMMLCMQQLRRLKKRYQKKVLYEDVGYDHNNNVNAYACKCPSCKLNIIDFTDDDISDEYDGCDGDVEKNVS